MNFQEIFVRKSREDMGRRKISWKTRKTRSRALKKTLEVKYTALKLPSEQISVVFAVGTIYKRGFLSAFVLAQGSCFALVHKRFGFATVHAVTNLPKPVCWRVCVWKLTPTQTIPSNDPRKLDKEKRRLVFSDRPTSSDPLTSAVQVCGLFWDLRTLFLRLEKQPPSLKRTLEPALGPTCKTLTTLWTRQENLAVCLWTLNAQGWQLRFAEHWTKKETSVKRFGKLSSNSSSSSSTKPKD